MEISIILIFSGILFRAQTKMAFYEDAPSTIETINGPTGPIVIPDDRLPGTRIKAHSGDPAERKIVRPIYPNYGPSYDYNIKEDDEIIFTLNSLDPRVMLNMDKTSLILGSYLVFQDDSLNWTTQTVPPTHGIRASYLQRPFIHSDSFINSDATVAVNAQGTIRDYKYTSTGTLAGPNYSAGTQMYRNIASHFNEFLWRGTHTFFKRLQIRNINSSRIVEEINFADIFTQMSLSSIPDELWTNLGERYGCSYYKPYPCIPCGSETSTCIAGSGTGQILNCGSSGSIGTQFAYPSLFVLPKFNTSNNIGISADESQSASRTQDTITFRSSNYGRKAIPSIPLCNLVTEYWGTTAATGTTNTGTLGVCAVNPQVVGGTVLTPTVGTAAWAAYLTVPALSVAQSGATTGIPCSEMASTLLYDKGPTNSEAYKLLLSTKANCMEWEYLLPSEYLRNGELIWLKPEAFELRLTFNNIYDIFTVKRFGNYFSPISGSNAPTASTAYPIVSGVNTTPSTTGWSPNSDLQYYPSEIHLYNVRLNACFETFSESTIAMLQQSWTSDIGLIKDYNSWWSWKLTQIPVGTTATTLMITANDIHNMKSAFIVLVRQNFIAVPGEDKFHFCTGEYFGESNPLLTTTGYVNSLQFYVGNDPYPESPILISPTKRVELREYVREALHGSSTLMTKDSLSDDLFLGFIRDRIYMVDQNASTQSNYAYLQGSQVIEIQDAYCSGQNCFFMMAYDFRRHPRSDAAGLNLEGRNLYINLTFASGSKVVLVPHVFICAEKSLILKPTITSVLS